MNTANYKEIPRKKTQSRSLGTAPHFFFLLFAAAVVSGFFVGRKELVDRESEMREDVAGVFVVSGALFFGNAVIKARDEKLGVALELDD